MIAGTITDKTKCGNTFLTLFNVLYDVRLLFLPYPLSSKASDVEAILFMETTSTLVRVGRREDIFFFFFSSSPGLGSLNLWLSLISRKVSEIVGINLNDRDKTQATLYGRRKNLRERSISEDFVVSINKEHIRLNIRNLLIIFSQERREPIVIMAFPLILHNTSPPLPCRGIRSVINTIMGRMTFIFLMVFFTPIWESDSTNTKSVRTLWAYQVRGRKGRMHINRVNMIFPLGSKE